MLKNIRRYAFAVLATFSIAAACTSSGNSNFNDVDEIADENESNLPKATEVGANRAGAHFEVRTPSDGQSQTWLMNFHGSTTVTSAEISIVNDSLQLTIPGLIRRPYDVPIDLIFTIPNLPIDSLSGLQALSNNGFLMSERRLRAAVTPKFYFSLTNYNPIVVSEASLGFSRCRRIYENGTTFKGVSVAGKFTIRGTAADTISVTISDGRFDLFFTSRDGNNVFK